MDGTPEELDIYRRLEANGDLTCRVVVPLWQKPDTTSAEMRDQLPFRDDRGRLWRCGAAKFFIDGVIETGTAWLVEPDTKGQGLHPSGPSQSDMPKPSPCLPAPASSASPTPSATVGCKPRLTPTKRPVSAAGVHHRIEHIELVQERDVPRFAELGVVASMQPLHMAAARADGSDEWAARVGPERTAASLSRADPPLVRRDPGSGIRLDGRSVRPAPGHGLGATAPHSGAPGDATSGGRPGTDRTPDAGGLHDRSSGDHL